MWTGRIYALHMQVTMVWALSGNTTSKNAKGNEARFRKLTIVIHKSHTHDFALVKLTEPFQTTQPFSHCDTPEKGNRSLGVVGYPGDKDRNGDHNGPRTFYVRAIDRLRGTCKNQTCICCGIRSPPMVVSKSPLLSESKLPAKIKRSIRSTCDL